MECEFYAVDGCAVDGEKTYAVFFGRQFGYAQGGVYRQRGRLPRVRMCRCDYVDVAERADAVGEVVYAGASMLSPLVMSISGRGASIMW